MAFNTLLLAGLTTLLVALVYAYVGLRLLDRKALSEPAGRAMAFFSLWWLATALNQAGGGLLYVAASQGWTDLDVQTTYVVAQRLLLALSLVGLMEYLLYLFRGRSHLVALLFAYSLYAAIQLYTVLAGRAEGVAVWSWRTDLDYEVPSPAWTQLVNLVFIVLPPVTGSVALWSLRRKVETNGQRFRIAAVSLGLTLWWVFAIVAGQPRFFEHDVLQGLNRLLGLSVAILILLAYEPPGWMRRRFGLEPYRQAA